MKILTIAWKDTLIRFRDRNALILMLAAPLVLSAIIGSAFGNFISGGDPTPFAAIPVLFVNDDEGELGAQFYEIMTGPELETLLQVTIMDDLAAAREIVQRGEGRAAVYIPPNFSATISGENAAAFDGVDPAVIGFYADPSATITPNIVRGVVVQIANSYSSAAISTAVTVEQLKGHTAAIGPGMAELGNLLPAEINRFFAENGQSSLTINAISVGLQEGALAANPFAFFAPSMGILFLMFSMMDSTRSILDEEQEGTLDRLINTPTTVTVILLGKIGGVFLTGILQFVLFVLASRFIFDLSWGNSLPGLVLMTLAIVLSLTSLGTLIAAFARDANQANIIGGFVTLFFAALGGNFVPAQQFPDWLAAASKITITRWGLDGFTDLAIHGLGVSDILLEAGVLMGLGTILFFLSLWQFKKRIAR